MKIKKLAHYFALISLFLSACTSDLGNITEETGKIVFKAEDFKYANQTRTSFDITDEGAKFTWSEKDTVGIFPDQGSQVYFSMAAGSGTNTASFDGGGWALKSSSTYAAYYPFKGNIYLDKTTIPVSYEGQKQVGNNSTAHLGAYDYMAAVASTPENGNVNFNFKHLGALVQISAIMPKPINVKTISINISSEKIIVDGSFDLTTDELIITPITKDKQIELQVENVELNENNLDLTTYIMLPPCNLSNEDMIIKITGENNESYYCTITGKSFENGKAYKLVCNDIQDDETFLTTFTKNTIAEIPQKDIDGTYIIATASNLKWFMENASSINPANYKLMSDITMKTAWKPISWFSNSTFDGNNHKIINLSVTSYAAAFFVDVLGSTIKNLIFINPYTNQYQDYGYYKVYSAALACKVSNKTEITNCGVIGGRIYGESTSRARAHVGGLIGFLGGKTVIKGCFVRDTEVKTNDLTWTNKTSIGGLCGNYNYQDYNRDLEFISCYTYNLSLFKDKASFISACDDYTSFTSCYYDSNYIPMSGFNTDRPFYSEINPISNDNFTDAIKKMNESLTDCDYVYDQDGLFIKK